MLKVSFVSDSLLQIIKLCVNLNSTIIRCTSVIPKAVIGEPSAVFSFAVVGFCNCPQCSYKLSILVVIWQLLNGLMPCRVFQHEQLWQSNPLCVPL